MTTLHIIISIILALVVTFYFLRWITATIAMKILKSERDHYKNLSENLKQINTIRTKYKQLDDVNNDKKYRFEKYMNKDTENLKLEWELEKAEQRENYRLKRIDDLENEIVKLTGNKKRKSGRKPKHIS